MDSQRVIIQPTKNPDELSGHFEGDIIFMRKRAASVPEYAKWTDGIVPYVIDNSYGIENERMIQIALDDIESRTCIKFVNRTEETDYLSFEPVDGCFSTIGRQGGKQLVSLTENCFFFGVIIHEVLHSLGFWHEHNRRDRDDYIQIVTENIVAGDEDYFEKYSVEQVTNLGLPYDYGSVMHGSSQFRAKNGTKTIVPIPDETIPIGQRADMSPLDVQKLNAYYNCDERPTTEITSITSSTTSSHVSETTETQIPTTKTPVMTSTPNLSDMCRDILGYELVPSPYNCSEFFVCWDGRTELRYCPDGLYFNPSLDVCDWPHNVPCNLLGFTR
ncbi:hypothetical protein QYM36_008565 [Artemia franciscana]|uniref:Metalloendopeptidase n=3 Tax=Artemia franciscana TaxID=6661 RepID=A0AA88IQD9_ARTSF|nr:hypothetical protein QYM36_008565 [Artemia franciscana]